MGICKYCGKEYHSKSMGVHVLSCKLNPKYEEYLNKRSKYSNTRKLIYDNFEVTCYNCTSKFTIREPINKFPQKQKYFCSKFCSSSNNGKIKKKKQQRKKHDRITYCAKCNKEMVNIRRKYCDDICMKLSKTNVNRSYRHLCRFKFNVNDFPEEFDLKLIEEYGWYTPTNSIKKESNINGVSRDHKLSVSDGEKYNISPDVISHPANCQILIHSDNISKNKKSSITLDELLLEIERWNNKYF